MTELGKYRGVEYSIEHESYPEDPRSDGSTAGTFAVLRDTMNECELFNDARVYKEEGYNNQMDWDKVNQYYLFNVKMYAIIPIYTYGDGVSVTRAYNSSMLGYAYITQKRYKEYYGEPDDIPPYWAEKYPGIDVFGVAKLILENEINTYNSYICNDVFSYEIPLVNDDTMYGFYGDDYEESGLMENIRTDIDWHIKVKAKQHGHQIKAWIKHLVPLTKRKKFNYT
jgi:hypothetical protein